MSCCGDREKFGAVRAEQKWDYINFDDFKSPSCWAPMSYGIIFISLIISVSVYAVDTFTAVNLLVFDRWSGLIKPAIPLHISRWIFAGCILLSFALLFYRWLRAIRVMQNGSVAQSYLDPLAVRIQSVRMGEAGRGWKRFLVFAALTKSKKGADYVALFTYFSFEAWLRIVFAEGPRQVINALTLYSVMKLNLIPTGKHAATDGHSPVVQFFVNIGVLASSNKQQAAILFGMLFTLVVWVITAINLAIAVLMYMVFLWHHIPSSDGGLKGYCRRKINTRVERIVGAKVAKALAKESHAKQRRDFAGGNDVKRQPTLPNLETSSDDKPPPMPLSRQTTETTLPAYVSRPSTSGGESLNRQPTLPDLSLGDNRPPGPSRTATQSSDASYASNAPLLAGASEMGYAPPGQAHFSTSPPTPGSAFSRPAVGRSLTGASQGTQRSYTPGSRPPTAQGRRTPGNYPMGLPPRSNTAMSNGPQGSMGRRTPGPSLPPLNVDTTSIELQTRPTRNNSNNSFEFGFGSFTPSASAQTLGPPSSTRAQTPNNTSAGGYVAFSPSMPSSLTPGPDSQRNQPQTRNLTQPLPLSTDYFGQQASSRPTYPQRSGTAPLPQSSGGYDDIYDSYADPEPERPRAQMPPRAATTTPGSRAWMRQPRQGGEIGGYGGPRY